MIHIERRKPKTPEISIAPLVDCVFLLLIFFLLTSTFAKPRGIRIELPSSSTATKAERQSIEIAVADSGEIRINGAPTTLQHLPESLEAEVERGGKRPVYLVADRRVVLDTVTQVIDCARQARLTTVAIATRRAPQDSEATDE